MAGNCRMKTPPFKGARGDLMQNEAMIDDEAMK